ncbi:hypothetical protein G7Y79_00005g016560 [Physcia stellaris]|nr:hypothetical protein G7Y79_00005g016560 [Physcia stellaris]
MGSDAPPPAMQHFANAQVKFQPPLIANGNAFLGDVFSSDSLSPTTPISAGFYRLAPGPALIYEYTYDEMKILLEGEMEISDEASGKTVTAKGGCVFLSEGESDYVSRAGGGEEGGWRGFVGRGGRTGRECAFHAWDCIPPVPPIT